MQNGIHTRLPVSSLEAFKEGLEFQAEDEGVTLEITVTPDGEGPDGGETVTVRWVVMAVFSNGEPPPVAVGAADVRTALATVPPPTVAAMPAAEVTRRAVRPPPPGVNRRLPAAGGFVLARKIGERRIFYMGPTGRGIVRQDGSRAWRNNNPGNIRMGDFTKSAGAIGDDGAFAIFPDEKGGFAALSKLLRGPTYSVLTLRKAMLRYAPPSDDNDTEAYIAALVEKTKITESRVLSTFSEDELQRFMGAIRDVEGWKVGIERPA